MMEGRQQEAWSHTFALMATIANLFAEKGKRIDVLKFVPAHLKPDSDAATPDETPEQVAGNWSALKQLVEAGRFK
jgi:hypothetical protein